MLYHPHISTPLRQQYLEIKSRHRDAILLFRIGDFYEAFDEDARTLARELDIVLTSKPMGKNVRSPLAGVPVHSLERHLATLISRGYRVAICEQLSDAPVKGKGGRGLIERDVVRVVTPGTIIEPGLLRRKANNYLAAFFAEGRRAAIAYADVTTGEFAATELDLESAFAELERIAPAETIVPQNLSIDAARLTGHRTPRADNEFAFKHARSELLKHFNAATLQPFGLQEWKLATAAAGALVSYLRETQNSSAEQLTRLTSYRPDNFMQLDAQTLRSLEVFETDWREVSVRFGRRARGEEQPVTSLIAALDLTLTPMGGRLLRRWLRQPLMDATEIARRQEHVAWLVFEEETRKELRAQFENFHDLERLAGRVRACLATPQELLSLLQSLERIERVRKILSRDMRRSGALLANLPSCEKSAQTIRQAIDSELPTRRNQTVTDIIRTGYSEELDSLRALLRDGKGYLAEVEQRERARTGIKSLRVGFNKVFGYYIEVTKPNLALVPSDYTRKQTLTNAERFITLELKEHETLVANAEERMEELQRNLFRRVCSEVGAERPLMLASAGTIAYLDAIASFAETAARHDYVRPTIYDVPLINIIEGRHPVIERIVGRENFMANDVRLGGEGDVFDANAAHKIKAIAANSKREKEAADSSSHRNAAPQIALITGPNMSGKSTYLRQTALIMLMAHVGSFVPARAASIGLCDRIFTRAGLYDRIGSGESTFMTEMVETAHILHHATNRSLILFDELGRGTSTYDGLAVARSVVEYIHNHPKLRALTLFATHYHELAELETLLPRLKNLRVEISEREGDLKFLYKVSEGAAMRSYGVYAAQLAGLPAPVIRRARELLSEYESHGVASRNITSDETSTTNARRNESRARDERLARAFLAIDPNALSPVEALMKIYELRRLANEENADESASDETESRRTA